MKLIVCEKPSQAEGVAKAIGGFTKRGMTYFGQFEGKETRIVPCRGHLLMLKEPSEVVENISWNDPSTLLPIPSSFSMKVVPDSKNWNGPQPKDYLNNIQQNAKGITELIIATDSDREGEAIGWEVVSFLKYKGTIRRAWFAGGTDLDSYKKAMSDLRPSERTRSWARAAEARGRGDWMWQFLVRAYTYYGRYGALGGALGRGNTGQERVVSVGRVQLPVIWMVFERDEEIRNFIAVNHYKVSGDFTPLNIKADYKPKVTREMTESEIPGVHWEPYKGVVEEGKAVPLDKPLFVSKEQIDAFKARLKAVDDQIKISSFKEITSERHPPKAFSLGKAQKEIGKKYKQLNAEALQVIIEDLYEQGWISYPRTEHEEIPISFYEKNERNELLNNLANVPQLKDMAELAREVHNGTHDHYKSFMPKGFSSKEMEHHGLLPTKQKITGPALLNIRADKKGNKATPEMMQFAYLAVAKQFLQMMLPPAKVAVQTVEFTAPAEDMLGNKESVFGAKAEQIKDKGWLAYTSRSNSESDPIEFKKGAMTNLSAITTTINKTKPPSPYTEVDLVEQMGLVSKYIKDPKLRALLKGSSGIGTPATRSTVIKTVKLRGYLEVRGKTIHCTQKGSDLLKVVPSEMSSPELTAVWEDVLGQIESEKNDNKATSMRDDFVANQNKVLSDLIVKLEEKYRSKMKEKPVSGGGTGKPSPKMISFMENIAKSKGVKAPRKAYTSFEECSAFIEEHKSKGANRADGDTKPSDAQIKFADGIWKGLDEKVTDKLNKDDIFSDFNKIREFIDKNKDKAVRAPSEAQIKFAKKLISELPEGELEPDGVFENADICSKFIDSRMKSGKGKGKGSTRRASRSK